MNRNYHLIPAWNLSNLAVLFFFLLSSQVFAQTKCDCSKYRTGKFEVSNGDGSTSVFKRTQKYQTEKSGDIKLKDRIEWIDQCTFKLHPVKIKDDSNLIGDQILIFEFIETFKHAYLARVKFENNLDFEAEVKVYEHGFLDYDK